MKERKAYQFSCLKHIVMTPRAKSFVNDIRLFECICLYYNSIPCCSCPEWMSLSTVLFPAPIPPPMKRRTGLLSLCAIGTITSVHCESSRDTSPIAFISSTNVAWLRRKLHLVAAMTMCLSFFFGSESEPNTCNIIARNARISIRHMWGTSVAGIDLQYYLTDHSMSVPPVEGKVTKGAPFKLLDKLDEEGIRIGVISKEFIYILLTPFCLFNVVRS